MSFKLPGIYEMFPDLLKQGVLSSSGPPPPPWEDSPTDAALLVYSNGSSDDDSSEGSRFSSPSQSPCMAPKAPSLTKNVSWTNTNANAPQPLYLPYSYSPPSELAALKPAPSRPKHYNKAGGSRKDTHPCPHCPKRFDRPSSLRTHLYVHSGATPFVCPILSCGREFNVRSNLRRHLRCHERSDSLDQKAPSAESSILSMTGSRLSRPPRARPYEL